MPLRTVVLAIALANAVHAAAPLQPTFVGAVDQQGRLTPIAIFDGEKWWNRWPWEAESESIPKLQVPDSLRCIPREWLPPGLRLPVQWRLLRQSGNLTPIRAMRISRPPESAVMDTFVIQTTYRGRARIDADEMIAVSGPGTLGRFVAATADEQGTVLAQVSQRIERLEREETDRWRAGETYRNAVLNRVYMVTTPDRTEYVTQPPRDVSDFVLTKAERTIEGHFYYYLDGEKLFTVRPNEDCMMNLSSTGIVVADAQRHILTQDITSRAWAEYCGDRASRETPLATVQVGDKTLWVFKSSLEDGYDYSLLNPVTGKPIKLNVSGRLGSDPSDQGTSSRRSSNRGSSRRAGPCRFAVSATP